MAGKSYCKGIALFDAINPVKHIDRYLREFSRRHNIRELNTIDQIAPIACNMVGERLKYWELTA